MAWVKAKSSLSAPAQTSKIAISGGGEKGGDSGDNVALLFEGAMCDEVFRCLQAAKL